MDVALRRADFSGQGDIFDGLRFGHPVTVVGLGGSGSAIIWLLAKMGVMELFGYDPDDVEPHNVPAQLLYSQPYVEMSKAAAVEAFFASNMIDERQQIHCYPDRVNQDNLVDFNGIVIMCVDSMESRRQILRQIVPHEDDRVSNLARYKVACRNVGQVPYVIDTRMGARALQVFVFNPEDDTAVAAYQSSLFSDEDADPVPYGARTFIGGAATLAGIVADQIAALARGKKARYFIELDLEDLYPESSDNDGEEPQDEHE